MTTSDESYSRTLIFIAQILSIRANIARVTACCHELPWLLLLCLYNHS